MPFSLPRLARAHGVRRDVTLRPITPTQAMAADLAAIYAPAWQVWRDGIDRIMAAYDPKPLGDNALDTGKNTRNSAGSSLGEAAFNTTLADSPDAVQAILNAIGGDFLRLLITDITPGLRRWTVRTERWHRDKWIDAVRAGTGVDLSTVLSIFGTEDTLEVFVNRNAALVTNVSDQTQAKIADAVWRGYQNRTPSNEVAKELREVTDLGRKRAQRIAADQNVKLSAALDMERQAEAGLEQYRWRHSGKKHPRLDHLARNGDLFRLGEPKEDTPGQAPYCGCRAQAHIALMDEI